MASESAQKRNLFAIVSMLLLFLVGLAVCGGIIWFMLGRQPIYRSVCRVMVLGDSANGDRLPSDRDRATTSMDVQLVIVSARSEDVLNSVWQKLAPATRKELADVRTLSRDLVNQRIEGTDVVQIEFDSNRQAISRDVVQTLMEELRTQFGDSVVVIAPPTETRVR